MCEREVKEWMAIHVGYSCPALINLLASTKALIPHTRARTHTHTHTQLHTTNHVDFGQQLVSLNIGFGRLE